MKGIGDYLNLHATALTVRAKRNKVLASNIANAATPNFKARDINFQALINKAEGNGPMRTTDARHFKVSIEASAEKMKYRTPVNPSRDGNTVEMNVEEEFVEMLEAKRQYANNIEVVTTLRALMMRTINMGK